MCGKSRRGCGASLAVKSGDFVENPELGRQPRMKSIAVVVLVVDSYWGPVLEREKKRKRKKERKKIYCVKQ